MEVPSGPNGLGSCTGSQELRDSGAWGLVAVVPAVGVCRLTALAWGWGGGWGRVRGGVGDINLTALLEPWAAVPGQNIIPGIKVARAGLEPRECWGEK